MPQEGFKRKLTAILSADVEGYSRLMDDNEEATVRTLTSYRTAIADLAQQFRGRVVDTPGDNVLAEFTSVVDAVNCAVEIQRELAERNAELAYNRKMEFRIGVNLGDVIEEEGRIYGDGVNIAARVESIAEAGGICISGRAYDQVANKLGLEYENLGEHQVKNISTPIRVYRVLSLPGAAAHRVVQAKETLGRRWRKIVLSSAAVVIVVVVVLGVWQFYIRRPSVEPASVGKMAFPLPEKPSIAVLAFDNLSGDPEQDYLGDGIAEDIITQLSQIYNLFVIARSSSFSYKGKKVKIRQVAEELGVKYVLEGSVQKSGDRVKITAQLIDAITGKHLWAHRYDREVKDFFAIQDEITREVVEELAVKLVEGEGERVGLSGTQNLEAWTYFRKALAQHYRFTPEAHLQARKLYKKAIELDPDFPGGYVMLGYTYAIKVRFGWSKSPKEDLKRAEELANKALALNDSAPKTHSMLAYIYFLKRLYDKAIQHGQSAIALAPSIADSHAILADTLMYVGRSEEAIEEMTKAMRLAPFYPSWYLHSLGQAYYSAGRFEEAIQAFEELQKRVPGRKHYYLWMAVIYSAWGREEQARAKAEQFLRKAPTYSLENFRKRLPYKDSTEVERILNFARKAGIPETPPLPLPAKPSIAVLPFANISGDPKEDYLSDGITEQIITALSKTPRMLVIARNSVFTYKGKPVMVQQVSKELGVRYVLEGSVQRSGDRLRTTAQLIDAKTGNHLWSERYDRDLKDLFDLQDDITKNVIMALQVKLTLGDSARIYGKDTANLEAYLKVMKGVLHLRRFNKDDNEISRRLIREAIALDPNYAYAYVLLAWTYYNEANHLWTKTPAKSYEKAIELAKKAISLDEQNALAYLVLANVYAMTGQLEKAMAAGKKGLSLDPANSLVNVTFGMALYNAGKFKEAIPLIKKAIPIDPKHPNWYLWLLGMSYFYTAQQEEAITVFKKWISREPSYADAHASLGLALTAGGKPEEAVEMFKKALSLKQDRPGWHVGGLAVARLAAGQPEEAIATLREVLSRDPENGAVCLWLSVALTSEGEYEEALSMAKKAVSLKEKGLSGTSPTATFYWRLGISYQMMGQYEEAIEAFKKVIGFGPDYVYAHVGLTASYSLAGRMVEAHTEAAEVLRINPKFSLEGIAKNGFYNFKKADKEHFINALSKAGLK